MSIDVTIIGSNTKDLETMLGPAGVSVKTAGLQELLRLAQPASTLPHVVVLDIRHRPEMPPALALLKKEHPSTGVVIVAGQLDPAVMLEAMRAGVTEWIAEPIAQKDFAAAVLRVAGRPPQTAGELIAVVGAKGGVGATTVAVNLATTLSAAPGGRTLLIDLHPAGGDAALFLGAEPAFSLLDALGNRHRLDEAFLSGIVTKTAAGPDLLASPDVQSATPIDGRHLRTVVEFAMRCYRFVVLDVSRTDPVIDEILGLASTITVVTTQELAAIRSAGRTAVLLRQRHGVERVQTVVNRYDPESTIGSADVARATGGRVGHTFPSNYRLALDAMNKGRPVVIDNHNKLASAFAAYARSLSGVAAKPQPADRPGLLNRLTGRR